MKNLRSVLDSVLEKSTFQLGKIRILHRAILEYLTYTEESTADLIELLKDHLIHMLHTRDGARIAQYCILHAGPKDRKHIVKSFKGLVHAIAKEQYGHTVLLTCFECVDDTVLVGKAIVNELFASKEGESTIQDLLCDKHASTVVMFLLNGRNSKYLPLFVMQELAAADEIRKSTTKKEDSVRSEQLLALVSPLASAAVTEHCNQLMRDKHGSQVVCMAVEHLQGDTKCILDAIVSSLAPTLSTDSLPTQPKEEFNAVKKLRKEAQDAKLVAQGIDMTEPLLLNRFATITFKTLLKSKALGFDKMLYACLKPAAIDWVKYCIANTVGTAGCVYVFISLLEQGDQETIADLKKLCKAEKGLLASIEQPAATPNLNANKRKADHVSPLQLLKSLLL